MTVFIAHASQDKGAAESLAEKLRQRAFLVELDTGERAIRPLSTSDAVIGLISKDFVFSPYKLQLEKRLLDAWADGQLLQVKLDHSFAPIGLRDLPAIDASFEAQRDFTWNKVADAVRALRQNPFGNAVDMHSDARAAPPPPMASAPVPVEWEEQQSGYIGGSGDFPTYDRAPPMARKRAAAKGGGGLGLVLLLLMLIGGGAAFFLLTPGEAPPPPSHSDQPTAPTPPPDYAPPVSIMGFHFSQPILMAAAIAAGLVFMAIIAVGAARKASLERKMGKPAKPSKKAREITINAPRSVDAPLESPEAKPDAAEPLVFISYARADQPSVDPLAKAVKDSGHPIWIDTDALNAGTSWAGEIVRAIKAAGHVLIMCSPRSFESDQVKREVYLADRYKKPLMPVFLEAAEPPEDFEYFFAGVQWLKLHEAPEADRAAILTRALPAA